MPMSSAQKKSRRAALRARDGDACFYCDAALTDAEASIEHLLPLAANGPNHLANLALACTPCNRAAKDLSIAEKVRLRETRRLEDALKRLRRHTASFEAG